MAVVNVAVRTPVGRAGAAVPCTAVGKDFPEPLVSLVRVLLPAALAAPADWVGDTAELAAVGDDRPAGSLPPGLRRPVMRIEAGDNGGERLGGVVAPSMGLPPRRGGLGGGECVKEPGEPTLARLRAWSLAIVGVIHAPSGSAAGAIEMAESTAIESSSSWLKWRGVDALSSIIGKVPRRV